MTIFSDNFDDNILDLNKWQKVWWKIGEGVASGDVYERNQRLELEATSSGTGYGNVGVVSRDRYDLRKGKVQAYVACLSVRQNCKMIILISPIKMTDSFGFWLSDYYAIWLDHRNDTCIIDRRVAGEYKLLYEDYAAAMSNVLKIEIEAGFIRFYEGNLLRVYDAYALPSYECYIYLLKCFDFTPELETYTDWIDDFYCEYCGTLEEKQEAQTQITQQKIADFLRANWLLLSVLGIILAVIISIILGVW